MNSKKPTGRIIACLLVFALLMQYFLTTSTGTALAAVEPTISSKSQEILVGKKYDFNINNKVKRSTYRWKSSNSSVATVNEKGLVTGVSKGKATITCTVSTPKKSYSLTAKVTIRQPAVSIEINNKIEKIYVGEKYNLNKTISPAASNDKIIWTSSDSSIAKPDKNGIFTALKPGQFTITARTIGGKKDSVTIRALDDTNSLTLTKEAVINGKISLKDVSYDYITIDSSVGNAEIVFDNVKVIDTLEMETNAAYTVRAINSEINRVVSLEEEKKAISSFALDTEEDEVTSVAPTFIAEAGTLVVTVDARGNVSVKQEGKAEIGTVTVNRKADGSIELNLDGFKGNLVVNTISNADIAIVTKNCDIPEATIGGTSLGQKLSMKDDNANGASSNIGKIKVDTSATLNLDVPAKEMEIGENTTNASVTIEKPIERIINSGASTRLQVNNNVSNIVSTGSELNIKVEAGSTIKGIEMTGASSMVNVALGSTIENIVSRGSDSAITGKGKVNDVKVEGNNTQIDTKDTNVSVGENVEGTVQDGEELPSGSGATPTPAPTPAPAPGSGPGSGPGSDSGSDPGSQPTPSPTPSPTPTPIPVHKTGEIIKITNPGDVWALTDIQMTADYDNITWSVYNTQGYATINQETGVLSPSYGTVRVVATSTLNPEVYGAVDIVIQNLKFVRIEPLEDVIINEDRELASIDDLINDGVLPKEVSLIYEKGDGSLITIRQELYDSWFGSYYGGRAGNHLLKSWINTPLGYEHPEVLFANVIVRVNVNQTDNRIEIKGFIPFDSITISTDEHLIKADNLINYYSLFDKEVIINLPDGGTITSEINGYIPSASNQFNGAEPGTYIIELTADIPLGYMRREIYQSSSFIMWSYYTDMIIPVTIYVDTPQTPSNMGYMTFEPDGYGIIPDTTQPKIIPTPKTVSIESVKIEGCPATIKGGIPIDFSGYASVSTDSVKASDKRVTWTYDGLDYFDFDKVSGKGLFDNLGTHKIRATSVVDNTKYAETTIVIESYDSIKSIGPLPPMEINQDMGIYDFRTMISVLEKSLPKTLDAVTEKGNNISLDIRGWNLENFDGRVMIIYPEFAIPIGYTNTHNVNLLININVPQKDNRIVVVSGSAITATYLLQEDKYATHEDYLLDALFYKENNVNYIMVNATLFDNSQQPLLCAIENALVQYEDYRYYDGTVGKVMLRLRLVPPDGFKAVNNYLDIYLEVDITVKQTSIHELLWIVNYPTKLDYTEGEFLDLTGLILRVGNGLNGVYVGPEKLEEHGLELHLDNIQSPVITTSMPLVASDIPKYIYIYNPVNLFYVRIGPINITN